MPRAAIRALPITNRMQNRWDSDADRCTTPLALLVHGSRLLGAEPLLVLHGGGNTSLKQQENGRTVLYVKGSGADLRDVTERDFTPLAHQPLTALLDGADVGNVSMAAALAPHLLARAHRIPFYVACPLSTVDMATPNGAAIPIEERDAAEIIGHAGCVWAPAGVHAANPAFDVTPARLVSALITDRGVILRPDRTAMRAVMSG